MRLVLDASAAVRIVLRGEQAPELLRVVGEATAVLAPGVFLPEVANALWKYHRAGGLSLEDAVGLHHAAVSLIDEVTPDGELATESLAEASRWGHPVYDLLYAVLARRTGAAVLTRDARLVELLDRMGVAVARP